MSQRKRLLTTAAAGLAVGSMVLAGCSTEATPSEPQTLEILTVWAPGTPDGDILADVVAQYEEETGIEVTLTAAGDETGTQYEVSVLGGEAPDIVLANLVDKQATWYEEGIVLPADDFLVEWGLDSRISEGALNAWTADDGALQGLPYSGFVWPVWYNMDLLAQVGIDAPPTSTDELIDASEALAAVGIPALVVGGNDFSGNKLFFQIIQSFMPTDEAVSVFGNGGFCDSANAMRGIELFVELRDAGVFVNDVEGYTADQMTAAFFEGDAAIMPSGSWAFSSTPEGLNVQLGGFPVPEGGSFDRPTAYEGWTSTGIFFSQDAADNEAAVRGFVELLYSDEIVTRMIDEALSPRPIVADEPFEISNELLGFAINELPEVVEFAVFPDATIPGALNQSLIRQTSLAYGTGDAAAVCSSLDSVYAG